jgi:RimJ/RimL family protein N-acetyltransferase
MPTRQAISEPTDQPSAAVRASCAGVPLVQAVQILDFVEYHRPALERDEVRHNVILANLGRLTLELPPTVRRWTLGARGACAVQTSGYPIVLGELMPAQCRALADATRDLDYPGVVGSDRMAQWFAERAIELGLTFHEPIPLQIHVLRDKPNHPGSPGYARMIGPADVELFAEWTIAFLREAVPHDPLPNHERLAQIAAEGRHQFWIVDGEPVSMAGIARRMRHAAAIAGVYTPPALRGRGYAGSVTAAVVERIFAEGKSASCLYTDLRNPASNRCYAKLGFEPACASWHYPKARVVGNDEVCHGPVL